MADEATPEDLRFRLLGPVEAYRGGLPLHLGGAKLRTLLAALLLAEGRVVADSALTALLWGEEPPATSVAQIHTYASRLRQLLGPSASVLRQLPGYALRLPAEGARVDLLEFQQRVDRGTAALAAGDPDGASSELRSALDQWQGTALGGVSDHLAEAERQRLEEERRLVLEKRIDADLELGRHTELIPELTALVAAHPLQESLYGRLITALYRAGRQGDALAAYQACRSVLDAELGVEPCAALRRLQRAVLAADPALQPAARPEPVRAPVPAQRAYSAPGGPPATGSSTAAARPGGVLLPPSELPAPPGDFIGRQRELLQARTTLCTARRNSPAVVAVSGLPGVGKTALALQAAHQVAGSFPDGRIHLDLRGSTDDPLDPAAALGELLQVLGIPADQVPADPERRARTFRSRVSGLRLLLVLDDARDARQVRRLLPTSSGSGVLVTSRSRLTALEGVRQLVLHPFGPVEAEDLLVAIVGRERAAAEREAVATVATACGGLPLALRIAGARIAARPHWPVARFAGRLAVPGQRLDELRSDDLSVHDRLLTAYAQLGSELQRALRLHSLLDPGTASGGFSAWTSAVLLDQPIDVADETLAALAERHWVRAERRPEQPWTQYRLHGLVREFAVRRARAEEAPEQLAAAGSRVAPARQMDAV